MWRFIILSLITLISACQSAYLDGVPSEHSPYYQVPVDSKLILNRTIAVKPARSTVYFQRGRIMPWYDIDLYGAYCALVLERKRDVEQTIKPAEFNVHEVSNENFFTLVKTDRRYFEPDAYYLHVSDMDGGNSSYQVYATVMDLRSDIPSEVRRLTCAAWNHSLGMPSVTLEKIRQSLGDYFSFRLAR